MIFESWKKKAPEQLKMEFSLWSRAAVEHLIEQEFGIKLQVRSIVKYVTSWGFTPRKPIKRAYEQCFQRCKLGWRGNTLPLSNAPEQKGLKFTGMMRLPWSTQTCAEKA